MSEETQSVQITEADILTVLKNGEMESLTRLPYSSNYNLLVLMRSGELELPAVYKPRRGENPLWDFRTGTLCQREVAAYQVCTLLGWPLIPPTILRDGVHGIGSVQFYVEHDDNEHYFTVQEDARYAEEFRQIVLFDFIANNADRKSGHCLIDHAHRLWAIDHGICFHEEYKLRTVIWEFSGHPIDDRLLADVQKFHEKLSDSENLGTSYSAARMLEEEQSEAPEVGPESLEPESVGPESVGPASMEPGSMRLAQLLSKEEQDALIQRTTELLETRVYPEPPFDRRSYPWPPV